MSRRIPLLLALCAVLALPVADAGAKAKRKPAYPQTGRLASFSSCTSFLSYVKSYGVRTLGATSRIAPPGPVLATPVPTAMQGDSKAGAPQPAPTAAPQAPGSAGGPAAGQDFSETNVQEAGIDEPDIVKTDGSRIFAVENSKLHAVDVTGAQPKLAGSLDLSGFGQQLLLKGNRLLIITTEYARSEPQPASAASAPDRAVAAPYYYSRPQAVLTEVDVSDPAAMKVIRTLTVDGSYVDARRNGDTARVVISSRPTVFDVMPARDESSATATRRSVRAGGVTRWLPASTLVDKRRNSTVRKRLVRCNQVRRPAAFSGLEMVTVLTVDLDKGLPAVDTDTLMTDAETVYGSPNSLYIASQRWVNPNVDQGEIPARVFTSVHRFDASQSGVTTYRSSGAVSGLLLSSYALSESAGRLRVASTDQPTWFAGGQQEESQSHMTVLGETGGKLETLGRVSGLGKGERIYAVRYVGDTAFVVTFRQVDPLYTIDLSNPAAPRVLGELKILGYSAYLHPISEDLLLGVGQDATPEGRRAGTQISLFDIRDLANVRVVAQRRLGSNASSSVDFEPKAFLYWPRTKLAVIPVTAYGRDSASSFFGAFGFHIGPVRGVQDAGQVTHPDPAESYPGNGTPIDRSLVARGKLFTISAQGLRASDLDNLRDLSFTPFPGAPSGGGGPCCVEPQPATGGPTAMP